MLDPAYDQTDFRGRNDDGGEAGATWIAAANTDWTQFYDEIWRLRFVVAEVNGTKDNNREFQLQYNINSTGWTNVTTTSSNVQAVASANFADGDATTQQIGTGTFTTGRMSEDGVAGDNTAIDFAGGDQTEVEWALNFVNADVSDGDTVQFRAIFADGTTFSTYSNTPTVTVDTSQTASVAIASSSASAVSPTAAETKTLSGTCTLNGSSVSGATVFVVDTTNDSVQAETTSDSNGDWSASVPTGNTYHTAAQYDDGSTKYNEYSKPFLVV